MQVLEVPHVIHYSEATGKRRAIVYNRRYLINSVVMGLGDAGALALAFLAGGFIRWAFLGQTLIPTWSWAVIVSWLLAANGVRLIPGWGLGIVSELRRTVVLLSLIFACTAVVLFLAKQSEDTSRFTITMAYLVALPVLPFVRTLNKKLLISANAWGLPTAIYGAGETARNVIDAFRSEPGLGYDPLCVFDDDPELWGDTVEGVPVLGGVDQSTHLAPVAVLAMSGLPPEEMRLLLDGPLSHYRKVVIVPELAQIPTLWVRSRELGDLLGLEITSKLLDPIAQLTKRTMDLVLVIATMPFWVTLCGLAALAIWLEDRGNPLFYQKRVGYFGKEFNVRKFRTMVLDAENVLERRLEEDPDLRSEWESNFKLKEDPRITRVGKFLRKTSIDELPQLVNVLKGEMSLVGPRPLPAYHHDELPGRVQIMRMRVRPGMTGMWQVSGRSDVGNDGFVRWDSYYVLNWSPWLDTVILFRTLKVVLSGRGAY